MTFHFRKVRIMITNITADEAELISKLMNLIEQFANKAIAENETFNIGVSGNFLIIILRCRY